MDREGGYKEKWGIFFSISSFSLHFLSVSSSFSHSLFISSQPGSQDATICATLASYQFTSFECLIWYLSFNVCSFNFLLLVNCLDSRISNLSSQKQTVAQDPHFKTIFHCRHQYLSLIIKQLGKHSQFRFFSIFQFIHALQFSTIEYFTGLFRVIMWFTSRIKDPWS